MVELALNTTTRPDPLRELTFADTSGGREDDRPFGPLAIHPHMQAWHSTERDLYRMLSGVCSPRGVGVMPKSQAAKRKARKPDHSRLPMAQLYHRGTFAAKALFAGLSDGRGILRYVELPTGTVKHSWLDRYNTNKILQCGISCQTVVGFRAEVGTYEREDGSRDFNLVELQNIMVVM